MDSTPYVNHSLHSRLMSLGRTRKKIIMVVADLCVLPLALWSAYALRLAEWWPLPMLQEALPLFFLIPLLGIFVFVRLGLYRAVVRYMGTQAIWAVLKGVILLSLSLYGLAYFLDISPFPRSVPVIFAMSALIYVGGSRLLVRSYYHWLLKHYIEKEPVLIYGAGGSGVQLATAIAGGAEYIPVGFVDDDPALCGGTVYGLPVYPPSAISVLLNELDVSHVLLALPNITKQRRRQILESLAEFPVHVKTMPSMAELVSGESVDSLREVELEDLLGRDPVPPNQALLSRCIEGKVVLVSGAGGSIGSEICRQVLRQKPDVLVLFEVSEYALYSIEQELMLELMSLSSSTRIYPVLGSVVDRARVENVVRHFAVNTIYHAAAYKHVPLVEHNIFEGIRNNVEGTLVLAEVAQALSVEHFVLISTDKAVRPTNVMGATKRLAELVLQSLALDSDTTTFSMVRFGNVLGSSGSVVPLFRQQIAQGGPVTVTHQDITRYFMTIPEAASLVVQAGAMAQGGDVFVLDMGEPVKIIDLATRMIRLMGYEVKSGDSPEGDIAIAVTGLRPGEKLYEELLIGDNVAGTAHPKIMRACEEMLSREQIARILELLNIAMSQNDHTAARMALQQAVSGFKPVSPVVDWLASSQPINKPIH
ncbi:polysaccharide biosynthesis protein [Pontibacter sp. JAM-7]|uniref:polysaccharide biosynthesis protein n=1 Tax=Pontibacter sp. JAM-7 TaxID=3366581 RepID=UPI003AF5387A